MTLRYASAVIDWRGMWELWHRCHSGWSRDFRKSGARIQLFNWCFQEMTKYRQQLLLQLFCPMEAMILKSTNTLRALDGAELIGSRTFSKSFLHSIMVTVKEIKKKETREEHVIVRTWGSTRITTFN